MYDIAIIGGGPGGVAAGVYAGRKKLKTIFLTDNIGGQSLVSDDVRNWIGHKAISGVELAKSLTEHLEDYKDMVDIHEGEKVEEVTKEGEIFKLKTAKEIYEARAVVVVAGSRRRRLGIPGEEKFEGRGVVYCSTCDAPLFRDRDVAVIGGGNAGVEAVIDLLPYAKSIQHFDRNKKLKADEGSVNKIQKEEKVTITLNKSPVEVKGETIVEALVLEDVDTKEKMEVPVQGVFVEIGSVPNSEIVKTLADINERGEVVVNHKTFAVDKTPGLYTAGDVCDSLYKQNNISVGDAIKALLSAYHFLMEQDKEK
ncbi:MAG: FAD-dependent oxidoreductase [bacterium]